MDLRENLKNALNPQQYDAVMKLDGPLLLLAGAGSGKTRVLTYRFANLVLEGRTAPENIWCVTFTNKAAEEMQRRVSKILSEYGISIHAYLWISTFHSSCARLLRDYIHHLGYQKNFNIYDPSDQLSQIKKVMAALELNDKVYPPKNFQKKISWAKMLGLKPEEIANSPSPLLDKRALAVYTRYEEEMFRSNALDFDDLLLKTLEVLEKFPEVLQIFQNKFQYIMVDEYQDTNAVQYRLVKLLAAKHRNLCVVGDEDQSVYSWRGADIQNIFSFEKDFPDYEMIKLEQNYRSSQMIVKSANAVIANNTERKNKVLFTDNDVGDPIVVREEADEYAEARFVARSIETIVDSLPVKYSNIAVFYRTNAQSRVIEDQFRTLGIPYKIIGGLKFYERMEVKDAICYLRFINNPNDDAAFRRIINTPTRGIGKTTVDKIEEISNQRRIPMAAATEVALQERVFNAGTSKKLQLFLQLMVDLKKTSLMMKTSDLFIETMHLTGYEQKLKAEDTPEAKARRENLEEFLSAIRQFEKERGEEATLSQFLEEMALISDSDQLKNEENCIYMMTLHLSKGLEYPYVFIIGMEEGLFPSLQKITSGSDTELEEERRLAYVGITRAEKQLCLLYARKRNVWGNTQFNTVSRFIDEIPKEYKVVSSFDGTAGKSRLQSRMDEAYSSSGRSNGKSWEDDHMSEMPAYEDFGDDGVEQASYKKGMRVRHPSFGPGYVYEVNGNGDEARISILFDGNQLKTFVAKFARLERV